MILIVEEATNYIERIFPKFALILKNGTILRATLEKKSILKVFPIVSGILENLPIKYMYIAQPVFIFRVTDNILLILLTSFHENSVSSILNRFYERYHEKLDELYETMPNSLKEYLNFSIFSVARNAGPEPFAWQNISKEVGEDKIFKYSITSMMLLMDEIGGAKRRILNFHPYVHDQLLGVIYLFQIPMEEARGSAFDCSLVVAVDYNERAFLYQLHYELEKIFSITADEITEHFIDYFKEDPQRPLNAEDRRKFTRFLEKLVRRLDSIPIKLKHEDVKDEMLNSIRSLSDMLNQ